MPIRHIAALAVFLLAICAQADGEGHSKHGSAFDSGMRTKPWVMEGIGTAPFPITSKSPEVQKWFDQGNELLHSFWFEEAERSFRWCLKLDPDCAMAYWGLARCGLNWFSMPGPIDDPSAKRFQDFLKEAVKRKYNVPERERLYIEAWENAVKEPTDSRVKVLVKGLQDVVIKYPEDIEAKALLALFNIGQGSAFANQLVIQEVLAKNPMHPGALHASIHNWDGLSSEQAIHACELYGKSAPGIGHARHMPGHIYSKIGMWHEAAIAMDSAARTELQYMNDRLSLPFENWNFPHNRNYLCYIQEQLGMAEASINGARDLLNAPHDPIEFMGMKGDSFLALEGRGALLRALVKFERWDEILNHKGFEWDTKDEMGKAEKAMFETLAYAGLKRIPEAKESLKSLKELAHPPKKDGDEQPSGPNPLDAAIDAANGMILLADGQFEEGQAELKKAADQEQKDRDEGHLGGDPPSQPWPVIRILGDSYRQHGDYPQAIECYEKALKYEVNDGFSLSGLALAHFAAGNRDKAAYYAGRLEYEWSQCDPNLKWKTEVEKLGLHAKPIAETFRKERIYRPKDLDKIGPMNWQPFLAPKLQVVSQDGKPVSLSDYSGKNVLLVFFLGDECVHCVGQLKSINDRASEFSAQDTVLLGVCSAPPADLKASAALGQFGFTFLSDKNHENARRFASYDDFEEMELHSTILIDKFGRVRWKRTGGDPFTDIDFLVNELKRINTSGN